MRLPVGGTIIFEAGFSCAAEPGRSADAARAVAPAARNPRRENDVSSEFIVDARGYPNPQKTESANCFGRRFWQARPTDMQLTEMTAPEVRALSKDTPVVIPVAALEQHGGHLPVFTDSMLLGEIIRRLSEQFANDVLFAPLLWLGNSHHHLDYSGTLSASPRNYLNVLRDLAENFIRHGFRRLVFLNGHGGNDVPGRQATFELRQKHRDRSDLLLLFGTYWLLGSKPRSLESSLVQEEMGHACEWETSMILRLRPDLVKEWRQLPPVEFGDPFPPAHRAWVMQDRSAPGHIGHPAKATPEKGERLFEIFAGDAAALLRRVSAWDGKSWNA
jgi:creatinine amidohydrolase